VMLAGQLGEGLPLTLTLTLTLTLFA
jgi:hypothetical protein